MRLFKRALNKAQIDVTYSQGFNPQAKFSIASPLSLGVESEEEYMDIELNTEIPVDEFIENMNAALPTGIQMIRGEYINDKKAIASMIAWALYEIRFESETIWNKDDIESKLEDYLSRQEILMIKKKRKRKRKIETEVDIRSLIKSIEVKQVKENKISIETLLKSGGEGNLKPIHLIKSFKVEENIDIDIDSVNIKRTGLFIEEDGEIIRPI